MGSSDSPWVSTVDKAPSSVPAIQATSRRLAASACHWALAEARVIATPNGSNTAQAVSSRASVESAWTGRT